MPASPPLSVIVRRFGLFAFMALAMLTFGDEFPFSNFPMYSVLPESVICMRLTDNKGTMIPSVPAFGIKLGTTILKKQMERELRTLKEAGKIKRILDPSPEACRDAGQRVLDWALKNHPPVDPALSGAMIKLEQTTYTVKKGKVEKSVLVIGEGKAQTTATSPKP